MEFSNKFSNKCSNDKCNIVFDSNIQDYQNPSNYYCWACTDELCNYDDYTSQVQGAIYDIIKDTKDFIPVRVTNKKASQKIYSSIKSDIKKKSKNNNRFQLLADLQN